VILRPYAGVPGSDYINANYIRGASGSVAYIASQGPLANTLADFWRMVVEAEVRVIVMACSERESGKVRFERSFS
jgi:tyrosine-protein phosphatase non-receptor type 12/18/22